MTGRAPALGGIRVVDLTGLLPGPWASLMLAQLGADVVWVQRPGGDPLRRLDPGPYACLARGKEIVELDLKDPAGRARLEALVDGADVVMEGFRPATARRLGVDAGALRAGRPRLVCCSLSGYGAAGPYADRPGHDINYLSIAGVLALSGSPDGPPAAAGGVPLADLAASLFATQAILAALLARERTGEGASLEVPIAAAALKLAETRVAAAAALERPTKASMMARGAYGAFRCADGGWISVGCIEDHFWQNLARALSLDDLLADARLGSYRGRCAHAGEVNAAIAARLAARPRAEWLERLAAADVPVAPVLDPWELDTDAQVRHWGMLDRADGARGLGLPYVGLGVRDAR